jgi:3-methyladenine DNA glycosylase AlkC
MKMFGDNSIDNYESMLIQKLFNRYSATETISEMHQQHPQFFLEFAKAWPKFLRNPSILTQLTRLKSASILVGD